jgi:hypothetical protein
MPHAIARLRELDVGALRARWHTVFGRRVPSQAAPSPAVSQSAYRLQADHLGDLDPESQRLLDRSESPREGRAATAGQVRRPAVTVLGREWSGQMQPVTVLENGFAWKGRIYPSLSEVALAITGTGWNGPRFFGLG